MIFAFCERPRQTLCFLRTRVVRVAPDMRRRRPARNSSATLLLLSWLAAAPTQAQDAQREPPLQAPNQDAAGAQPEQPPPAPAVVVPDAPLPEAQVPRTSPVPAPEPDTPDPVPLEPTPEASFGAVAIAPAPGARIEIEKVPRNVQRLDSSALALDVSLGLAEALNARLGSATLTNVQNNPLQPDLQYRGFTASPLLGTPQGIAVYQNGVRINEAFGDVVQWDLLPQFAIAEAQLIPGANPVYGLNALGGSLVLRAKNGFNSPGYRVQAIGGSFARYQASVEYGRAWDDVAAYAGASVFGEQGFRNHSPSSAQNVYADLRQHTPEHEVGLSATLANTDLTGNGPAPIALLAQSRRALYTWPDNTRNQLLMVTADAQQRISRQISIEGVAYLRHATRGTSNGDEGEFEACADGASDGEDVLCDADGKRLRSETDRTISAARGYNGLFNTTETVSEGYGGTLQASVKERVFERQNQFIAGVAYDGSHVSFLQRAELGRLTFDRAVQGEGVYLLDDAFRTDLAAENRNFGVYVSDTFSPFEQLAINASARLNVANAELDDRVGAALDGNHTFTRINPALGATYTPVAALTLFAGYSEGNRAPSASELSCADPDRPCRVPNAFITDPPLRQVVSRGVELGLRTRAGESRRHPLFEASLAGFGTRNADDILFVAGSRVGTGYFRNAGATQRAGIEAAMSGHTGILRWYASYTLLRATFETDLELPGGANPSARGAADDEGGRVIDVRKGDRIPGLPTHAFKAGITVAPVPRLSLGLSTLAQSSQPFRGDEANVLPSVPGYGVLNARVGYQLFDTLQLVVNAQNLLDNDYETFGVVADPSEVLPGMSDPRFLSPGAPLGIWAGIIARDL